MKTLNTYRKQLRKLLFEKAERITEKGVATQLNFKIAKLNQAYADRFSVYEIGLIQQDLYHQDREELSKILYKTLNINQ